MKKQTGFTLMEILIALLLGLIVVGGALSVYISTIKGSSDTVKSADLNHDLDSAMQIMINDIRRAGFWGGAVAGSNANNNPFTASTTKVQIFNHTDANGVTHPSGCILYSYDANANGTVDNTEFYGFRLDRNAIWMRMTGTTTANCNDGNWAAITDDTRLIISDPQAPPFLAPLIAFDTASSQCKNISTDTVYAMSCDSAIAAGNITTGQQAVETLRIDIKLTGKVLTDNTVTKNLFGTVTVRNNRICIYPCL